MVDIVQVIIITTMGTLKGSRSVNKWFLCTVGAEFEAIYDSLVIQNDEYFVLRDFSPYAEKQEAVGRAYENRTKWLEMSILNIAQSGHFASDRTILQYSNEIWGIGNTVTQI